MAEPRGRRLYDVMGKSTLIFLFWFCLLTGEFLRQQFEPVYKAQFKKNTVESNAFFISCMPLHALVLFGAYTLCSLGYHLMVLEDCTDAHKELLKEVE
mmetsp:Transcript_27498/g.19881  ORF Transcript_27498/g.19881 Transcript_27498/m.19881 type:complete len:98 (-) Transcript_27498:205-498(-)